MTSAIAGRIASRLFQKACLLSSSETKALNNASKSLDTLMSVLMSATPATSLVASISRGRIFHFSALDMDFAVDSPRSVYHPAQSIHVWLAYGFITAIKVQVLAALWH